MARSSAEWVAKAEADYQGAMALHRQRRSPLPDLVCFHCQQCAEKYLKAFLQERGVTFPKTPDKHADRAQYGQEVKCQSGLRKTAALADGRLIRVLFQ